MDLTCLRLSFLVFVGVNWNLCTGLDYEYSGCFLGFKGRVIDFNDTFMSTVDCIEFCSREKLNLAAMSIKIRGVLFIVGTYDTEARCSCGSMTPNIQINDTYCDFPCPGQHADMCGGRNSSIFTMYRVLPSLNDANPEDLHTGNREGIIIAALSATVGTIVIVFIVVVIHRRRRSQQNVQEQKQKVIYKLENSKAQSRTFIPGTDTNGNSSENLYEPMGEAPHLYEYVDETNNKNPASERQRDITCEYVDETNNKNPSSESQRNVTSDVTSSSMGNLYEYVQTYVEPDNTDECYYNTKRGDNQMYEEPEPNSNAHLYLSLKSKDGKKS